MYSNFDVENFPPEATALLRLLGENTQSVSVEQMEHHLDLSERSLGRAIRRLVSYHLIQLDYNGAYQLTSRGRTIFQQLQAADPASPPASMAIPDSSSVPVQPATPPMSAAPGNNQNGKVSPVATSPVLPANQSTQPITRRLTFVVQPSTNSVNGSTGTQPITVLVGINAPQANQSPLGNVLSIALQLTASGCTLSPAKPRP